MLNISVNIARNVAAIAPYNVTAHVHSKRCESQQGGPHYLNNSLGLDSGDNIFAVTLPFDGVSSKSAGNVIREWLADYDRAASVVLHEPDGTRFACCNMVPNLPSLPDTWSATIEANIKQPAADVSYSMLRKEWYHKPTNNLRIDEHSSYSAQTRLVNLNYDKMIFLHRNSTFPEGHCEDHDVSSSMVRFLTRGGNHTLMSTADMYGFKGDTPDVYHGITGAGEYVRGIPCEKWTRNVTMPAFGRARSSHTYTFEFYFPVTSWMYRRESYHRMLSRVVLRSEKGFRGHPVLHYYDFIDMVPRVDDMSVFNPCLVHNTGKPLAGNCTCGLPGAPSSAPWNKDCSDDVLTENEAGEMAAVGLVCLIVGALSAAAGTFMYFTKCGGIERQQMKHQQFSEGTQMSTI